VALSAGRGNTARTAIQAGANRFLPKPVRLDQLLEVVEELA
jgi:FixJ family two-component response regulator